MFLYFVQFLSEYTGQSWRQYHQPIDEPEQLTHVLGAEAAITDVADQPNFPIMPIRWIAMGFPCFQMSQHHLRERVGARLQHGLVSHEVQQLHRRTARLLAGSSRDSCPNGSAQPKPMYRSTCPGRMPGEPRRMDG